MAITKPPKAADKKTDAKIDAFIGEAPDAKRKGVKKGNKEQISLTISTGLLARLDTVADRLQQSRAGMINLAIVRAIEVEENT